MRQTFAQHMKTVGEQDEKLAVLIGDISHFALQPFAQACPGRFYNVGILEATIVSMAAGLYHSGFYPVVHTIAPFIVERSLEQIKLDFCYQERGGNLITVGSAFDYSSLGCSHFCYNDIGTIKALPRTQVVYPASSREFIELFNQSYDNDLLTYFRLPDNQHDIDLKDHDIVFGKGILVNEGSDITLVVTGPQLKNAMLAAKVLADHNVTTDVIYIHTPKPFDYQMVKHSVEKTQKVIAIEEHSVFGGIGDEVLRCTSGLPCQFESISIANEFCHGYGSYEEHCHHFGLTKENIVNTALNMCSQNTGALTES